MTISLVNAPKKTSTILYLLCLTELEMIERERRTVERRIKEARFPAVKSLDSFEFAALPSLNKTLVLELARCEYVERRENIIAVGNGGTSPDWSASYTSGQ
jgi:DNA replication protein DnaC